MQRGDAACGRRPGRRAASGAALPRCGQRKRGRRAAHGPIAARARAVERCSSAGAARGISNTPDLKVGESAARNALRPGEHDTPD
jgi:hypothetical protein